MEQSNLYVYFKALSSPPRLKLFEMLYKLSRTAAGANEKECCGGIMKAFTMACEKLNLSRSTISHHFKELQSAGLITCERQGQAFNCQVNPEAIQAIRNFLK